MLTRRLLLTGLVTAPLVRPVSAATLRTAIDLANAINWSHLAAKGLLGRWQVLPGLGYENVLYDLVSRRRATLSGVTEPPSATSGVSPVTQRRGGYGEVRMKTGDYATVGDLDRYSFTDGAGADKPWSFMCWALFSLFTTAQGLMGKFSPGAASEYRVYLDTGGYLPANYYTGPTDAIVMGRTAPYTAVLYPGWTHIAVTYTGSEASTGCKIFLNGVRRDNSNYNIGTYTGMTNTTQPLVLGAMAGGVNSLQGKADDFRLYNYALPDQTVRALYVESWLGSRESLNWLGQDGAPVVAAPVTVRTRRTLY